MQHLNGWLPSTFKNVENFPRNLNSNLNSIDKDVLVGNFYL